ncbi:precorrin-3B synthase [Marmoricola sp. OAE513]|uniref:nitrite reductase n=1 Tax=Marmoricola sp. OAE513 TaxID=2817894 RepID=UPI001AE2D694
MSAIRRRSDLCPGALRPWLAEDGLLVRLRLIGGQVSAASLLALVEAAERYGDGRVHLTSRANLQVRAFPGDDGALTPEALAALEATGLLPTRTHELVRNVLVSPQTGLSEGRADLGPVAAELDAAVCEDPTLADLSGRFLFVLDDGRGDLVGRSCDLGLVVLDDTTAQLRVGEAWGPVLPLDEAAVGLAWLAREFAVRRGSGPEAPWHVVELAEPLTSPDAPDPRLPAPLAPLPYGEVAGGEHVAAEVLDRAAVEALAARSDHLIVTPWHGVLVPQETR